MSLRMSEEEYAELMRRRGRTSSVSPLRGDPPSPSGEGSGKRGKYGNKRVEIDGKKFDSKHEAGAYIMLMQRVRAGELKCVLRQVAFDLPGGIKYIADFVTILPDMRIEAVIDAKSEATKKNRVYINKKKQMQALYGIEIVEV
jgi:hypothetical protein